MNKCLKMLQNRLIKYINKYLERMISRRNNLKFKADKCLLGYLNDENKIIKKNWEDERGIFFFSVLDMKLYLKRKKRETAERENQAPMLWYWSVPENGMDMEDCEKIAKENLANRQSNRYKEMYIAFI